VDAATWLLVSSIKRFLNTIRFATPVHLQGYKTDATCGTRTLFTQKQPNYDIRKVGDVNVDSMSDYAYTDENAT
jgi:hypothetical protein